MTSPFKSRNPFRPKSKNAAPFDCPICCNDYPADEYDTQTFALGCEHRFCRDCWKEYLTGKIKTEGESARVQCMESGCNRVVLQEAVEELVEPDVSQR
jgi:ariadne-1